MSDTTILGFALIVVPLLAVNVAFVAGAAVRAWAHRDCERKCR